MISYLIIAVIILITTLIIIDSLVLLHRVVVSVSKVVDFPVDGILLLLLVVWLVVLMTVNTKEGLRMISHLVITTTVITTIVLVATLIIFGSLLLQSRFVTSVSEVVDLLVDDVLFLLRLVAGVLFLLHRRIVAVNSMSP